MSINATEYMDDSKVMSKKYIIYISLILLMISCFGNGITESIAKIFWLISLLMIGLVNFGAAFGIYLASVTIYNAKHVWMQESILERIDNYGLLVLILIFVTTRLKKDFINRSRLLTVTIFVFFAYILLQAQQTGLLDWTNFTKFTREFGLPFCVFLMMKESSLPKNEMEAFCSVVVFIGAFMALVSILEKFAGYSLAIPYWLGDPNINGSIGSGRSGGVLMQPEFNGFALCLIFMIVLWSIYTSRAQMYYNKYITAMLCLIGIYLTYTRAAWIAAIIAVSILVYKNKTKMVTKTTIPKFITLAVVFVISISILTLLYDSAAKNRAGDVGTIYYRANLWASSTQMIISKPLLGHGIGQFDKIAPDYQVPLDFTPKMNIPEEGTGTHNIVLNILVSYGLLGLILYILIVLTIYGITRRRSMLIWQNWGSAWVLAFSTTYLVNVQFLNAHEPLTNLLYFGTMGIIAGSRTER